MEYSVLYNAWIHMEWIQEHFSKGAEAEPRVWEIPLGLGDSPKGVQQKPRYRGEREMWN